MTYNFSLQPFYALYDYVVLMYSILLFDIIYLLQKNKKKISLGPWPNPVECTILLDLTYHWYIISAHWTEARKKMSIIFLNVSMSVQV